ncbi:MAG: DNA-3-methyladenine glycosylase [Myxococcota bacterium]|nr:DNA-3-methyladenine glycosylase [Myxococcota bacterium]
MTLLPQAFFAREVAVVARDLLGRSLVRDRGRRDEVVLRITEVEAYGGPEDTASHCRAGRTARNEPMWGPPGHAYVYLCYGLHQMLNVVTGAEGHGQAVLIRSCEPISGLEIVRARRGDKRAAELLAGPGKVGAALALDRTFSGVPLFAPGPLELHAGAPIAAAEIAIGKRVGVDFAVRRDRDARLRFAVAGSEWVSHRRSLAGPSARR